MPHALETSVSQRHDARAGTHIGASRRSNWSTRTCEQASEQTRAHGKQIPILTDASERLDALPWTDETRPLVDALMAAYADATQVWVGLAKARNVRAIESQYEDLDRTAVAQRAAGRAVRLAIGLPTLAQ